MTDAPDLGTESVRCFPFFAINSTAHVEFPLSRLLPDGVSLGRRQAPHPDGTVHPVPAAPFRDQVFMRHVQAASARVRGTHFPAGETAVPGGGVLTGSERPRGPGPPREGAACLPQHRTPLAPAVPASGAWATVMPPRRPAPRPAAQEGRAHAAPTATGTAAGSPAPWGRWAALGPLDEEGPCTEPPPSGPHSGGLRPTPPEVT